MREMRDKLSSGLKETIRGHSAQRPSIERLPNTLNVSFKGVNAGELLAEIDERWRFPLVPLAILAEQISVSPVLKAMKVAPEWAMGTIRFSVGKFTSESKIDEVIQIISTGPISTLKGAKLRMLKTRKPQSMRQTSILLRLFPGC